MNKKIIFNVSYFKYILELLKLKLYVFEFIFNVKYLIDFMEVKFK